MKISSNLSLDADFEFSGIMVLPALTASMSVTGSS
jgi:hypothetical protein